MNIEQIYDQFSPASAGMIEAIETHCGLEASRAEIERIAGKVSTAEQFMEHWLGHDWWLDKRLVVYQVEADGITGEWKGNPHSTCGGSTLEEWNAREDTDDLHFDTYEHFEKDDCGKSKADGETRLLCVKWY